MPVHELDVVTWWVVSGVRQGKGGDRPVPPPMSTQMSLWEGSLARRVRRWLTERRSIVLRPRRRPLRVLSYTSAWPL